MLIFMIMLTLALLTAAAIGSGMALAAGNLFAYGDFEGPWRQINAKANVPQGWTPRTNNYDLIARSTDPKYAGTAALHLVTSTKSGAQVLNSVGVPVRQGAVYVVGYWVYVTDGGIRMSVVDNTEPRFYPKFNKHHFAEDFKPGEWQYHEIEFVPPEGCRELRLSLVQSTERVVERTEAYIDSIVIRDMTAAGESDQAAEAPGETGATTGAATVAAPGATTGAATDTAIDAARPSAIPTIYQEVLRRGEPSDWKPANQNPPTFRWPMDPAHAVATGSLADRITYEIQYSTDPAFTAAATVTISGLDRTFYRPPEPLPSGEYLWRYRVSGGAWSEPLPFSISTQLPTGFTYNWEEALRRLPAGHPRIWVRPETVASVAQRARAGLNRLMLTQWKALALKYVGEKLALENDKDRILPTSYNQRIQQSQAALADAEQTMTPVGELTFLYLLTGDELLAKEAIRRVLVAVKLDPDGYTSLNVNDYANAEIVRGAAFVYDHLYDLLSPEEKEAIAAMLSARLSRIYDAYRPLREQEVYHSHTWQHILIDFLMGALVLYGEVPEADEWFEWSLHMVLAFYPWWGSVDGSSGGSVAYAMGPSFLHYSHLTAEMIKTATGIDMMDHPWFAANPYFVIYSHPPGGLRSQFGDWRVQARPSNQLYLPMLRYALRYGNPYARAYADAVGARPNIFESYVLYFLTDQAGAPAARPLAELPKTRAFPDAGMVFMHSDIENAKNNVMFEFRSSPLGSFGHGHADQNSFNINAFGEMLVLDSGYYIGYGDTHHYGWTVTTQAHNTILVDGQGQPSRNMDAYGQITAFFTGRRHHYTVGSAATAYGQAPVERFLRRVLWVEPNVYLIFDQVDTSVPTHTQWLLHSLEKMDIDPEQRWIKVNKGQAHLSAHLAYPTAGHIGQTSAFAVPVPVAPVSGTAADYRDQWHLTAQSPEKSTAHRWLAALFVDKDTPQTPSVARLAGAGWYGLEWETAQHRAAAGFSSAGTPVTMTLKNITAKAEVLSVVETAGAAAGTDTGTDTGTGTVAVTVAGTDTGTAAATPSAWSVFAAGSTEVYRLDDNTFESRSHGDQGTSGTRIFSSGTPVNIEMAVEVSDNSRQVHLNYQAESDGEINVRIWYPERPGLVHLDGEETGFTWDAEAGEVLLLLPAGEHAVDIRIH